MKLSLREDCWRRIAVVVAVGLGLAGCNTVAGAGQDITNSAYKVGGWLGG